MAISIPLTQGYSSGGSVNNAMNISQGQSSGQTFGGAATESSNTQAIKANNSAMANWMKAAEFNAEQAQIQRDWQEKMANTVYQRSIADMKKAGINPILAAGFGLGSASVGSGASASMSSPETFMGNSFADQISASQNQSYGESSGKSWQSSENGLITALNGLSGMFGLMAQSVSSSKQVESAMDYMDNFFRITEDYRRFDEPNFYYEDGTRKGNSSRKLNKEGLGNTVSQLLDDVRWNAGYTIPLKMLSRKKG